MSGPSFERLRNSRKLFWIRRKNDIKSFIFSWKSYHTFQVGSDTFEGGNSVQAHESGRHYHENCQSQRDQEESRGSGIVIDKGGKWISLHFLQLALIFLTECYIIFIVLICCLYLLAFMLHYTYLPSRAGRTTTPFGERSSRGIWSIQKTKRRRRIRLDLG